MFFFLTRPQVFVSSENRPFSAKNDATSKKEQIHEKLYLFMIYESIKGEGGIWNASSVKN